MKNKKESIAAFSQYGAEMTEDEARIVVMLYYMLDGLEKFALVTLGSADARQLSDGAKRLIDMHQDVFEYFNTPDKEHIVGTHTVHVRNFCPYTVLGLLNEAQRNMAKAAVLMYLGYTNVEVRTLITHNAPIESTLLTTLSAHEEDKKVFIVPAKGLMSKDYEAMFASWLITFENETESGMRIADYLATRGSKLVKHFVGTKVTFDSVMLDKYQRIAFLSVTDEEKAKEEIKVLTKLALQLRV